MLEVLLRMLAEVGPAAVWLVGCVIGLAAVFALYVGIAMGATLRAPDDEQRQVRYRMFRDLLDLFSGRRRR